MTLEKLRELALVEISWTVANPSEYVNGNDGKEMMLFTLGRVYGIVGMVESIERSWKKTDETD